VAQKDIELILLRQWASYLTVPIWIMDAQGMLLFYNEPAELVLGRRYDEFGEVSVQELGTIFQTADEDGAPILAEALPIAVALRNRHPAHGRVRIRALDGPWRTLEVTAFPIDGQGERHLGAVALFWEVSA
jgi:PAS domain-containing protein